jgi:hypothetical protein
MEWNGQGSSGMVIDRGPSHHTANFVSFDISLFFKACPHCLPLAPFADIVIGWSFRLLHFIESYFTTPWAKVKDCEEFNCLVKYSNIDDVRKLVQITLEINLPKMDFINNCIPQLRVRTW